MKKRKPNIKFNFFSPIISFVTGMSVFEIASIIVVYSVLNQVQDISIYLVSSFVGLVFGIPFIIVGLTGKKQVGNWYRPIPLKSWQGKFIKYFLIIGIIATILRIFILLSEF